MREGIKDDLTDNRTLECALAAGAGLVATGDKKHLLPLGSFLDAFIVEVKDFLAALSAD